MVKRISIITFQNKYFLVRDISTTMDRLATLSQFQAPNVRRCRGSYPVYGLGQPTKDGLTSIIQGLKEEGHQVHLHEIFKHKQSEITCDFESEIITRN